MPVTRRPIKVVVSKRKEAPKRNEVSANSSKANQVIENGMWIHQDDNDRVVRRYPGLSEAKESEEEPGEQGQEERELNDVDLGPNNIPGDNA
ncbi:unnamed protein product [Haemonchus placei]|uniref:Uncharacterized protein n=1 Tax=Haemonchus placei TaxID=6290 RepID=A0A0N4X8A0_HAEPC|nr:unnamed protein product [Haemonchus placei]